MFLHDLLARVYDTRERRGEGICTLRNFEFFCFCLRASVWAVSVVCGPCRWGNVQDRLAALRMFSHILLTTMCDEMCIGVSHILLTSYAPATSNYTAHGAWLQNAAMPQRPATPTLRLVLIIYSTPPRPARSVSRCRSALYCLISRSSSAGLSLSISS